MADLFGAREPIRVISLWQSWASLMAAGFKPDETRHWRTSVRGVVAIHAAKRIDVAGSPTALCEFAFGTDWARSLPTGCVVAVGRLVACLRTEDVAEQVDECNLLAGNFAPGRFAFRFEDVRPLREPVPLRGLQGFFNWLPPEDLEERLLPPVDHAVAARRWSERDAA